MSKPKPSPDPKPDVDVVPPVDLENHPANPKNFPEDVKPTFAPTPTGPDAPKTASELAHTGFADPHRRLTGAEKEALRKERIGRVPEGAALMSQQKAQAEKKREAARLRKFLEKAPAEGAAARIEEFRAQRRSDAVTNETSLVARENYERSLRSAQGKVKPNKFGASDIGIAKQQVRAAKLGGDQEAIAAAELHLKEVTIAARG